MRGPIPDDIKIREHRAIRDLVRQFPTCGTQLEAALSAAYRRALSDAGILPTPVTKERATR